VLRYIARVAPAVRVEVDRADRPRDLERRPVELLRALADTLQRARHRHQERDWLLCVVLRDAVDVSHEVALVRGGLPLVLGDLVEQAVAAPFPNRVPALDPLVGKLDYKRGLGQRGVA